MKNHDDIQEKLLSLMDPELNPSEKAELLAHLQVCAECRDFSARWEATRAPFSKVKNPQPSEDFVLKVMQKIEDWEEPAPAKNYFSWDNWAIPAMGYAVAIALMVIVLNQPSYAENTESVLLASVSPVEQKLLSSETTDSLILPSLEEELL